MQITINDHRKLYALQKEFASLFPNLKLEFFAKPSHLKGEASSKPIDTYSKTVAECRNIHTKGTLTISGGMTIADLQSSFSDIYGMHVSILKKEGDSWVEPANQNNLSLTEQNKMN